MINAFNAAVSAKADGSPCASSTRPRSRHRSARTGRGSRCSRQRRRRPQRREGPLGVSARICTSPASRWGSASSARRAVTSRSSSPPGRAQHPARIDGALDAIKQSGKPVHAKAVATTRTLLALDDRPTTIGHQGLGHVRRRRGDTGGRAGDQSTSCRQGRRWRLRPPAGRAELVRAARSRLRSTSSRTCRASTRRCSCSCIIVSGLVAPADTNTGC